MESELLTVDQVADTLKLSVRQVWRLTADGRLPAVVRLGRSVRWRREDIRRFVEAGCDMAALADAKQEGGAR